MKKTFLACVLALCLLAGCAVSARPVSIIPLIPIPEYSAPPASPSPEPSVEPPVSQSPEDAGPSAPPSPDGTDGGTGEVSLSDPQPPDDPLTEQLDGVIAGFPGFSGSVLVEKAGQLLLCRGYGMADAEKGLFNTPDTRFLVGSVTKQFTAMAIMQLYAGGLLDIKDPLSKYVSGFARGDEITLTNLLSQTSGIADFLNDDPELLSKIPTAELTQEKIIGLMKEKPLKFEPGSKYSYCNTNFLLLGYIVEKVSDLGYGDYLAKNVFEPLGMKNTGVFNVAHPPADMATGRKNAETPIPFTDDSGAVIAKNANATAGSFGAGCLYSTVRDLCLWDRALTTEQLLPKAYMDMIFTPTVHIENPANDWSYGYGWVIENDKETGIVYRHTGALGGFRAYNGLFTEHGITVIILSNIVNYPDRDNLLPAVKKALLNP